MKKDFKFIDREIEETYTFKFTKKELWWIRGCMWEALDYIKKPRPYPDRMVTEKNIEELNKKFGWDKL